MPIHRIRPFICHIGINILHGQYINILHGQYINTLHGQYINILHSQYLNILHGYTYIAYGIIVITYWNVHFRYLREHSGRDGMVVWFTYVSSTYYHSSCEFQSSSRKGILDTALCDKICLWITIWSPVLYKFNSHTI